MKTQLAGRFAKLLDKLRSSYWVVPACCVLGTILLAAGAIRLDEIGLLEGEALPRWMRVEEPESARSMLTAMAGAMITIASLTFSISIVALTLASSQFGSRLLYNFMRERGNQAVLGVLLGTFVYCLLVLPSVQGGVEPRIPQVAFLLAVVLTLVGVGSLIYFFHHVAESIQANHVISDVGRELSAVVRRVFPEADEESPAVPELPEGEPQPVPSPRAGLVQAIGLDGLVALASGQDQVLELTCRAGDYVVAGEPLALVRGDESADPDCLAAIAGAFVLGSRRTLIQDVDFAFLELAEVAVRALSPGINDPFTAMSCVDELGSGLVQVMERGDMAPCMLDGDGEVRVVLHVTGFGDLVGTAFDQIRQHGQRDLAVMTRLLDTLVKIAPQARTKAHRAALLRQGRLCHELAHPHAGTEEDREALERRLEEVTRALEG